SPQAEIIAIQTAFKNIEPLRIIWESFKGQILPAKEFLPNALVKRCKIPESLKDKWADYFLKAARFAKLLEDRSTGVYVNIGPPAKSVNTSSGGDSSDSEGEGFQQSKQRSSTRQPERRLSTTDAIDESNNGITGGNKLQKKIGNSYIIIYLDDLMSAEE